MCCRRLREVVHDLDDPDEEAAQGLLDRLAAERAPMLDELHRPFDSDRYVRLVAGARRAGPRPAAAQAGRRRRRPPCRSWPRSRGTTSAPGGQLGEPVRRGAAPGAHPGQAGRYAAEAAAVVTPAADRHASAIADVQGVLGDHQDAVVAEAWLRRAVAEGWWPPRPSPPGCWSRWSGEQAARYRQQVARRGGRQPQEAHELAAGVTSGDDEPILAAGGVLWRPAGDSFEILLIHRPRYDDWTLPKGKVGRGRRRSGRHRGARSTRRRGCAAGWAPTSARSTTR